MGLRELLLLSWKRRPDTADNTLRPSLSSSGPKVASCRRRMSVSSFCVHRGPMTKNCLQGKDISNIVLLDPNFAVNVRLRQLHPSMFLSVAFLTPPPFPHPLSHAPTIDSADYIVKAPFTESSPHNCKLLVRLKAGTTGTHTTLDRPSVCPCVLALVPGCSSLVKSWREL